MEKLIMDFLFLMLTAFLIFIRFILPVMIISLGIFKMKKNEKKGKFFLIIGILYLVVSVIYFWYSMI